MHDLFISYAREDEAWVERFCELLKSQGISIWKDSSIPTGKSFGRVIEGAIADARAVVVVWSHYSVESDWVRAEATEGLRRGILMPVRRDKTPPPLRFRTIQTIDLANWEFKPEHAEFTRLVGEIRGLIASAPIEKASAEAVTLSPSRLPSRVYLPVAAGILLAAGLGAAIWFWADGNERRELSLDLTAAAVAVLDELKNRQKASRTYWGYFLANEGGQSLVEQSVLLALEAVKSDATPQATAALRRGLVLLSRPLREFRYANTAGQAAISRDAKRLAWSYRKGIQVLHTEGVGKVTELAFDEPVAGVDFLADADYLVAVGRKGALVVWNISTSRKLSNVPGKDTKVLGFALDAGGSRVAVRQTGLVSVWQLHDGRQIAAIETDSSVNLSAVQSLDLSPDGRYLAFALKHQVRVWDLEKAEEHSRINLGDRVSSLLFDPLGKTLGVFSASGEVSLVTLAYGDEKRHSGPATRLSRFAPGATYLARASAGRIRVSTRDDPGKTLLEYAHGDNITDICFSQDDRLIASAGQDGMVRVWDLATARELTRFAYRDKVLAIRFSVDATTLTVIAEDGRIGIWPIEYSDPVAEACRRLARNLTPDEWRSHLPDLPYHKTCPDITP